MNAKQRSVALAFCLLAISLLATGCGIGQVFTPKNTPLKMTDLEIARNKLKQVEQKLVNTNEGMWLPLPQGVFQPSIKSMLNDLEAVNYIPPDSPANDLIALAKEYMTANNFNKAFAIFQEASDLDKDNPEPHFWMGVLTPATGGPPEITIWALGDAIGKDTSQQRLIALFAYRQRGIFYLMSSDAESSMADFSECVQIGGPKQETAPIFWQTVYINRGIANQNLGKTFQALQDYERALDLAAIEENPLVVKKILEILEEIDQAGEIPAPDIDCNSVRGQEYLDAITTPRQDFLAAVSSIEYHSRIEDSIGLSHNKDDLDTVLEEYQAIAPPPLYKNYHELQIEAVNTEIAALNAINNAGDYNTGRMKMAEAMVYLTQAMEEVEKIQKNCGFK